MSCAALFGLTNAAVRVTNHGPYEVPKEDVTVDGYFCGGDQGAVVYYPTDSDKPSPLISFAHGGGNKVDPSYKILLEGIASWGYVIIALKSAPDEYCWNETTDQIRIFKWSETSKFADMIDYEKKTGLLGHSMGYAGGNKQGEGEARRGAKRRAIKDMSMNNSSSLLPNTVHAATHLSANNADAVTEYNVGAAVTLHPVYVTGSSNVPIMFGTGSNDTVVPPSSVKPQYDATNGVAKVYANIEGATHFEPNTVPPNRWTDYSATFFDCYLLGLEDRCDIIFGSLEDSLCSGSEVPMTECESEGGP